MSFGNFYHYILRIVFGFSSPFFSCRRMGLVNSLFLRIIFILFTRTTQNCLPLVIAHKILIPSHIKYLFYSAMCINHRHSGDGWLKTGPRNTVFRCSKQTLIIISVNANSG